MQSELEKQMQDVESVTWYKVPKVLDHDEEEAAVKTREEAVTRIAARTVAKTIKEYQDSHLGAMPIVSSDAMCFALAAMPQELLDKVHGILVIWKKEIDGEHKT